MVGEVGDLGEVLRVESVDWRRGRSRRLKRDQGRKAGSYGEMAKRCDGVGGGRGRRR